MKIFLPLKISAISNKLTLPIRLYKKKGIVITLDDFTIKEKEWFFSLKDLKIKDNNTYLAKYSGLLTSVLNHKPEYHDYVMAKLKVVIEGPKNVNLQKLEDKVDLVFKIVIGRGFPIYKICHTEDNEDTIFNHGLVQKNKSVISRRNITLDESNLKRIKNLIEILDIDSNLGNKIELLQFYLNTAMSQVPNTEISGAFYVSILESIFVPENNQEIGYRFSMRLAKKREKSYEYCRKIKDLYNQRSKVFHGQKANFTVEELKFLEEESCWAIEEYLKDAKNFDGKNLDQLLLK